jgi:hypothetical protein
MKSVIWTDEEGYRRRSLLRDVDPDHLAPQGIPADVPDLSHLDWDDIQRELHNALVERGLFTWTDVQRAQNGVTSAVTQVFKKRLIALYKLKLEAKNG